jgi:hypothetical protein
MIFAEISPSVLQYDLRPKNTPSRKILFDPLKILQNGGKILLAKI